MEMKKAGKVQYLEPRIFAATGAAVQGFTAFPSRWPAGVHRRASSAATARTSRAASGVLCSSPSTDTANSSQRSRLGQSISTPGRSSCGRSRVATITDTVWVMTEPH